MSSRLYKQSFPGLKNCWRPRKKVRLAGITLKVNATSHTGKPVKKLRLLEKVNVIQLPRAKRAVEGGEGEGGGGQKRDRSSRRRRRRKWKRLLELRIDSYEKFDS